MSSLPKPVLRGHCARNGRSTVIGALLFGSTVGFTYWYNTLYKRSVAFENWVKTYDPEEHFKELVKYKLVSLPHLYKNE